MLTNVSNVARFTYNGTNTTVFQANPGEGLVRHEHDYSHLTACLQGRIAVRKEGKEIVLTSASNPLLLTANEWHEFEALDPNTIFINQYEVK